MSSTTKRYCSRGQQCTQSAYLEGEPAKLSQYNKGTICELCQRKESEEQQVQPKHPTVSDKPHKFQRFKRDLVMQLFTRRGPFWEQIKQLRGTRIKPLTQLPPPASDIHYPEWDPGRESYMWLCRVTELMYEVVPERYRFRSSAWLIFLSACVLYDPPETELLEFAAYYDPQPEPIPSDESDLNDDACEPQSILLPAIRWMSDPDDELAVEQGFYRTLIEEIGKRYLEPLGLDIQEMEMEILEDGALEDAHHEMYLEVPSYPYITVDEHTTADDVMEAFRAIHALQGTRPPAKRPPRDKLTALQCAILFDDHGWTYKQLAEHFGWGHSKDRTREHVKLGREILKES